MQSRVRCRCSGRGSLVLLRAGGCGGGRQLGQYPPDARWPTPTPTRTQTYIHLCTQMYNPELPLSLLPPATSTLPHARYRGALATFSLPHFCPIHSRLPAARTPNFIIIIYPRERSTGMPTYIPIPYAYASTQIRQFLFLL